MADTAAVLLRFNEAINAHDVSAARAQIDPAARLRLASGRELDVDGYTRFLQLNFLAFPDMHVAIERAVVDGDVVMAEEVMTGTHRGEFAGLEPTGKRVRLPMAHVARVDSGRIVELVAYHDTAGVLRQLAD